MAITEHLLCVRCFAKCFMSMSNPKSILTATQQNQVCVSFPFYRLKKTLRLRRIKYRLKISLLYWLQCFTSFKNSIRIAWENRRKKEASSLQTQEEGQGRHHLELCLEKQTLVLLFRRGKTKQREGKVYTKSWQKEILYGIQITKIVLDEWGAGVLKMGS